MWFFFLFYQRKKLPQQCWGHSSINVSVSKKATTIINLFSIFMRDAEHTNHLWLLSVYTSCSDVCPGRSNQAQQHKQRFLSPRSIEAEQIRKQNWCIRSWPLATLIKGRTWALISSGLFGVLPADESDGVKSLQPKWHSKECFASLIHQRPTKGESFCFVVTVERQTGKGTKKQCFKRHRSWPERHHVLPLGTLYSVWAKMQLEFIYKDLPSISPPAKVALPLSQVSMKWLFIRQRLIETQASDVDRACASVLSPLARCTASLLVSNISLSTKSIALGDALLTITPSFQTESFHYSHSHFYKCLSFSNAFRKMIFKVSQK